LLKTHCRLSQTGSVLGVRDVHIVITSNIAQKIVDRPLNPSPNFHFFVKH